MKKSDDTGLIIFALVSGVHIYLAMEHPVIFWAVFVPLAVIAIITFVNSQSKFHSRKAVEFSMRNKRNLV